MRFRLNPIPQRVANAEAPLRHRLAAFWVVIVLLCLPSGVLVASVINEVGAGATSVAFKSLASAAVLVNIVAGGDLYLGDYAHGENETLFLAGQDADVRIPD